MPLWAILIIIGLIVGVLLHAGLGVVIVIIGLAVLAFDYSRTRGTRL